MFVEGMGPKAAMSKLHILTSQSDIIFDPLKHNLTKDRPGCSHISEVKNALMCSPTKLASQNTTQSNDKERESVSCMSRQQINETLTELDLNINAGLLLKLTLIATY